MSDDPDILLMNYELAADELQWVKAVYEDFAKTRVLFANPKEALRNVLGKQEHRLPIPMDLSGPGPWRNGRNRHGRQVTAVFMPEVELHRHARSRTDQFPIYVVGEADAFTIGEDNQPVLSAVTGGAHFHNPPDAPHAFLPKVGNPIPENWEIAFIAITPRNILEDTESVSDEVRAAYKRVVGTDAPLSA